MTKEKRKESILNEINIHTRIDFEYLSQKLDISTDTIRRDIKELIKSKHPVVFIKGGVMSNAYHQHNNLENSPYNYLNKQKIARKLIGLLQKDMVLIIGGGTTISEFIKLIPNHLHLTIFTVNLYSAVELLNKPNIKTIFIGGVVSAFSQMTVGASVVEQLSKIQANMCIIGANALDINFGISDSDWETVEIKKVMIKSAHNFVLLSITEKIGTTMKYQISDVQAIKYLITELDQPNPALENFKKRNPQLIIL